MDGREFPWRDVCPHMGAPLSEGRYDAKRGVLVCPWHGYEFDAESGEFRRNPNEETFACLRGRWKSFDPAAAPKLRLVK